MARIYGEQTGTEKELLKNCPQNIKRFEDIKTTLTNHRNDLHSRKNDFYEKLPNAILNEKEKLSGLKNERQETEVLCNNLFNGIIERKSNNRKRLSVKKAYMIFVLMGNHIQLFKHGRWKKSKINKIQNNIARQERTIKEYESNPEDVFKRENEDLNSKISVLEEIKGSNEYSAAYGEDLVLNHLKALDNNYHIFCDKKPSLHNYITYRGKPLKSRQMDFVVVGDTGIFVIEVKTWSSKFKKNYRGRSPHEQVEEQGHILFLKLKSLFGSKPPIRKVVVPVYNNIEYDPGFKYVKIIRPSSLKEIIENWGRVLDEKAIERFVSKLERM